MFGLSKNNTTFLFIGFFFIIVIICKIITDHLRAAALKESSVAIGIVDYINYTRGMPVIGVHYQVNGKIIHNEFFLLDRNRVDSLKWRTTVSLQVSKRDSLIIEYIGVYQESNGHSN